MADLNKLIQSRYRSLLRASNGKFSTEDHKKIRKAVSILNECCKGEKGITDEPIILHSLSVAKDLVSELGLGATSVVGALLSECAGRMEYSDEELKSMFGSRITGVLLGLRKIESAQSKADSYQAENFLKLLLSLAEDIRVILIKLVDRLEHLRKLDGAEQTDRLKMASESYFLYAPLAHRLGLYNIKSEMEDIAMKYLDPDAYNLISEKLRQTTASRNKLIRDFSGPVKEELDKMKLAYTIKSRTKSIHSIWQKMKKQGVEFEEVYDLFAIRIILDSRQDKEKSDCWQVYSLVADLYQPNPSRLRDWISVPKSNGYESLHTTVIGPRGKWVEVQIRTSRMDDIAEKGLAAHTRYKGIKGEESSFDLWLSEMREILDSPAVDERAVMEDVTSELYTDEVFVFTPGGDLKRLKFGSTVLDFAFAIHTEVGSTCVGGKVNGKSVGLRHVLKNGDKVAVLTSKSQKPKQDWLSFCVTNKARSKIKGVLDAELVKAAAEGKEILQRRLKNWKLEFSDRVVALLISNFKLPNARELYKQIYNEKIDLLDIKDIIQVELHSKSELPAETEIKEESKPVDAAIESESQKYSEFLVIDDKVEGLDYKLAKCCSPVLGDRIFGFVTITEGIKIHRRNCPNAHYMMQNYPYRIVMAKWTDSEDTASFNASIKVVGVFDHTMITRIHDVLADTKVTLRNFSYENKDGLFEGVVQLFVPNTNILNSLVKKIESLNGVMKAVRFTR